VASRSLPTRSPFAARAGNTIPLTCIPFDSFDDENKTCSEPFIVSPRLAMGRLQSSSSVWSTCGEFGGASELR
jgi:hypothetical protein